MNPLIRPALPLLIAAALAACGKEETKPAVLSCQAPEAIGQLTDQIQAAVSPAQESGLPYFEFGASEVQAAFGQLGFEITDIRTTQAASEGSKTLSCEATLRLAPKPEAQTRIKQSIESYLEINETDGIDYNGLMSAGDMLKPDGKGGFIAPFSYTVSQTDNGDKLVVNVASQEIAAALSRRLLPCRPRFGQTSSRNPPTGCLRGNPPTSDQLRRPHPPANPHRFAARRKQTGAGKPQ